MFWIVNMPGLEVDGCSGGTGISASGPVLGCGDFVVFVVPVALDLIFWNIQGAPDHNSPLQPQ